MKKYIIMTLLLMSSMSLYMVGQNPVEINNTPQKMIQPTSFQTVASASDVHENTYAQMSFTIGEVFVGKRENTEAASGITLFEGFQHPTVIFPSAQRLFASLFLEGAYNGGGAMDTYLSTSGLLPLEQPFSEGPYFYNGGESINVSTPEMVDWILIEARTGIPNISGDKGTTTVETRAGFLMSDGSVVGENLVAGIPFYNLEENAPHYFCIRHRNHLDVLLSLIHI